MEIPHEKQEARGSVHQPGGARASTPHPSVELIAGSGAFDNNKYRKPLSWEVSTPMNQTPFLRGPSRLFNLGLVVAMTAMHRPQVLHNVCYLASLIACGDYGPVTGQESSACDIVRTSYFIGVEN